MRNKKPQAFICQVCGVEKRMSEAIPAELIREPVSKLIMQTVPDWKADGFICIADLNRFRNQYIQEELEKEKGELTALELQVVDSLKLQELLSTNINQEFDQKRSFGEHMADRVAEISGSWRFIIIFLIILGIWMLINTALLLKKPFDPYPFILLNLVLSSIAALQAPIIMMSQHRQEARDRLRSEYDYRVNLKAELEIRNLSEKVDHLLMNQWRRLMEIQEIQIQLMEQWTEHERHS